MNPFKAKDTLIWVQGDDKEWRGFGRIEDGNIVADPLGLANCPAHATVGHLAEAIAKETP